MTEGNTEAAAKEINLVDGIPKVEEEKDLSLEVSKDFNTSEENHMPSPQQEEEMMKKKYGGLLPKKPPLISNDTERTFFDSADWALGKVGAQKNKGPLEALRPKLQPTQHQQARSLSAYAHANDCEDSVNPDNVTPLENDSVNPDNVTPLENQSSTMDEAIENSNHLTADQNHQN